MLRLLGATTGKGSKVSALTKVWVPWNLEIGEYTVTGTRANCYNLGKIILGSEVVVSQGAYLYATSHDITNPLNPLITAPIYIDSFAWTAVEVSVNMGATIGKGTVVGVRVAVFKDADPQTVVGGNPAKSIEKRIIKGWITLDISVIILTYNEEIHIRRCLENVKQFTSEVYIMGCFSIDRTAQTAKELRAEAAEHEWPGNQAKQFSWALDNLPITTERILRLGADECLLPGLIEELLERLLVIPESVSALSLSRARAFYGKIPHHGIMSNIHIIRVFRKGKARYEKRLMDEHLSVLSGETIGMEN